MSGFGGIDRGVEGDAPYVGRQVIMFRSGRVQAPAVVLDVREDGWTVSLRAFDTNDVVEFVPHGGTSELGVIEDGTWVTPDQFEGWKIWAAERAERAREEG